MQFKILIEYQFIKKTKLTVYGNEVFGWESERRLRADSDANPEAATPFSPSSRRRRSVSDAKPEAATPCTLSSKRYNHPESATPCSPSSKRRRLS